MFRILGVAIQAKNNADHIVTLLCCEKEDASQVVCVSYVLWCYWCLMVILLQVRVAKCLSAFVHFFKIKKPLQASKS